MLRIEKLKSGYGEMEVLHSIDMNVRGGEIAAIIGPNGAGKTTVLKSIFNLTDIYSGDIFLNNENITKKKTFKLIVKGISFVPQGRQVFSGMTVLENLEMGGFTIDDEKEIAKRIEELFIKFPILREKKEEDASSLSGGQQQLLAIARALMQKPKLLLLDEPSLGLSPKAMKEIFAKIIEIRDSGVAIMIAEQNAKQAVEISDKTYILENGKIALEGGRGILSDKKVREIYFGVLASA